MLGHTIGMGAQWWVRDMCLAVGGSDAVCTSAGVLTHEFLVEPLVNTITFQVMRWGFGPWPLTVNPCVPGTVAVSWSDWLWENGRLLGTKTAVSLAVTLGYEELLAWIDDAASMSEAESTSKSEYESEPEPLWVPILGFVMGELLTWEH